MPNVLGMREELALTLAAGIVVGRDHPRLRHAIRRARELGQIVAVLRGIYAEAPAAATFETRCRALFAADPDAILVGRSAAIAHGWIEAAESETVHAVSARIQGHHPGYRLSRRRIEADHVADADGVRATTGVLTALDLARGGGPAALDDALRRGIPLDALQNALRAQGRRRGNRQLWVHLRDSRDEPWSPAERAAHRGLRAEGVPGWKANWAVQRSSGVKAFLDIALPELLLAFEIDGYTHHRSAAAFAADKRRDLDLALQGWYVVRIDAQWVLEDLARFARVVSELAAQRAIALGR